MRIKIYNSNRDSPIFDWNRGGGNVALGIMVAKSFVDKRIAKEREHNYQAYIKLKRDRDESVLFEWNPRQGNVRLALDSVEEFVGRKLGFNLVHDVNMGEKTDAAKV